MRTRLIALLSHKRFLYVILAVLIVQAMWIALSGRYPMAFDEDFHLGIIKLYAHHPSPFWAQQPPHATVYGAVFRDPSYLYQWLFSFPYRLIALLTSSQMVQVLALRFMNIALFASSVPLLRRLLSKTGASQALVHTVLLAYVLVPVVPLLAAQINYDNLFIPLVIICLLLTLRFREELVARNRLNVGVLGALLLLCLLTSLVKYAFLPIFLVLALYVIGQLYLRLGLSHRLLESFRSGLALLSWPKRALLAVALVGALGLFGERYGVNLVRYHTPVPPCDQVLSLVECNDYAPWARDFAFKLAKGYVDPNPLAYSRSWFYGMWFRLFFAVDGPSTGFETRGPLLLPGLAAIVFPAAGVLALAARGRRAWRHYDRSVLLLCMGVTAAYTGVLWLDEYGAYLKTGQPVAINGRYLLAFLPLVMLALAMGYRELLARRPAWKITLAGATVIMLLWGGGALTYVLRSRDAWYWDDAITAHANYDTREWLGPVVPGYRDPALLLH